MKAKAPAFIIWNAREIALTRELKTYPDGFEGLSWIISLCAVIILINESRLCQIIYNALVLVLSFLFLFYTSKLKMVLIIFLCLLFPFIFPHCLLIVIYFGKSIKLNDSDIKAFWLMLTCRGCFMKSEENENNNKSNKYKLSPISPADSEESQEADSGLLCLHVCMFSIFCV